MGIWCPCLGLGGAEAWQLALVRAVGTATVDWQGAVVLEGRSMVDPSMERQLASMMPVGYGLDAARALAASSDVIVSWAVTDVSQRLSGLESPPKMVMVCHFPGESPWGEGTAQLLSGIDRFVAVSELASESIPPGIRPRVQVIWNAVDADRLKITRSRTAVRRSWSVPEDALVAGFLGRLAPEKDPEAMIRLARFLPEAWHVVIVGEGRLLPALKDQAQSIGEGRIHLVGGDPAAGDVLNAFDSLVVPSLYESFGLTIAEGLWSGLPVIATRSGLAKLEPGLVRTIPVKADGNVLARAVLEDRADPSGTGRRIQRARAFASERLRLDRFARQWTALLSELAGRPVRAREALEGVAPCRA